LNVLKVKIAIKHDNFKVVNECYILLNKETIIISLREQTKLGQKTLLISGIKIRG